MANVLKCSKCGVYEKGSDKEPVRHYENRFCLDDSTDSKNASISLQLFLGKYAYADLCEPCLSEVIEEYLPAIVEVLRPYLRRRVVFGQDATKLINAIRKEAE